MPKGKTCGPCRNAFNAIGYDAKYGTGKGGIDSPWGRRHRGRQYKGRGPPLHEANVDIRDDQLRMGEDNGNRDGGGVAEGV